MAQPEPNPVPPPPGLVTKLWRAQLALAWERLWPAVWPVVGVAGIFVALALFDVLPQLPGWLHAAVLAGFAVALGWLGVRAARRFAMPDENAARRRLELASGLAHRPLTAVEDVLASGAEDPDAEVLWRLADPGELALDVGANIGQMTALLARRVGPAGRVIAFEPNAGVRAELAFNVDAWRADPAAAPIDVSAAALSDHDGYGELLMPPSFEWNRGIAEVVGPGDPRQGERQRIQLARLDTFVPQPAEVGVMKLDVEGHESAVLRGATALLADRRVRDVVYEDHARYPTAVSQLLENLGYAVLAIGATFWGPLIAPASGPSHVPDWESPSYLATREPERARRRLTSRGWRIL